MPIALARQRSISALGWLRIVLRVLAMLLLLLACILPYYLFRLLRLHNPWPRIFLSALTRIIGVALTYRGEKVRRGAFLLANHVSWIDIPALAGATGTAFIAHDGLASMSLLKTLCEMNDTVFIARHDRRSLTKQIADIRTALSDTGALTIFPEGTTSDGTGLLPFKSSLLSAIEPIPEGIAVQPVLLDYGPKAAKIAWVGEEHGLDNFLRILARSRRVSLTLHFLEPLSGEALASRKTIAATARDELLTALGR